MFFYIFLLIFFLLIFFFFFFNDTATTEIYTLSLHDALPITRYCDERRMSNRQRLELFLQVCDAVAQDRKSTRLNSSHVEIPYAVCCLKKKKIAGLALSVYVNDLEVETKVEQTRVA